MERTLEDIFAGEVEQARTAEQTEDDTTLVCPPSEVLEKQCYSQEALTQVLTDYGASPEILAAWAAMWDGEDIQDWIMRVSTAICYTPQAAEEVRSTVFAGTPGADFKDGFLYKIARGEFELRSRQSTQNWLRTAFKHRNQDRKRRETYQRTTRGTSIQDLVQQINSKYGTRFTTRRELEGFLQVTKGLGWDLPLAGGATLRLDDIRLDGAGPVKVTTRESLEHVPTEIEGDEPGLQPADTDGGFKSQTDFSSQHEFTGQAERQQPIWNGRRPTEEKALLEMFYREVGRTATVGTTAATASDAVKDRIGKVLMSKQYDAGVAKILGRSVRQVKRLRRQARGVWKNS